MKMVDYKSVLVKNNAVNCNATLFIYSNFDPICWISSTSKILKPGQSYLHRSEKRFKFEIKTIYEKKKKTVVDVRKWKQNLHFTILKSNDVAESDLEDHTLDKTMCIRKLNVENEGSIGGGRNLYEILKLDFDEIRKLKRHEQDEKIKQAKHREIRRWHSDKAGEQGDDDMAREVLAAYDILKDHEKRAEYHNKADYSKGWLSTARWKSIFLTECASEEQIQKKRERLINMALSIGLGIGGLVLSVLSAGTGIPVAVGLLGTLGAGYLGGGVQSFSRTIRQKSIEKGCDFEECAKSFGLGFVAGAVTGGAGVGITAGIAGIGNVAEQASTTTFGQLIGIGAGSASVGGAAFSLAADAEKKFIDGVDVTLKQVVGHALVGAAIGAVTGTAVGAVSGAVASISTMSTEVTSINIEGKFVPGLKRYGVSLLKNVSKSVTNKSSENVLGTMAGFFEERIDDDQENRPFIEHVKEKGVNLAVNALSELVTSVASTTADHVSNETKVFRKLRENKNTNPKNVDSSFESSTDVNRSIDVNRSNSSANFDTIEPDTSSGRCDSQSNSNSSNTKRNWTTQDRRQIFRSELYNEKPLEWRDTVVKATFTPTNDGKKQSTCVKNDELKKENIRAKKNEYRKKSVLDINFVAVTSVRFRYISKGHWISKMIVAYTHEGKSVVKEVDESGKIIQLPIDSEDVKVRFKVMRFISTWCDVKMWDRFKKQWFGEPHIFTYKRPPEQRTFTLDGSLYFERVINVTDEKLDDVNEI